MKKIFLQNTQIKIIAFILGYSFWYIFSQSHTAHIKLNAPICFYNIPEDFDIACKENITVELCAKRADLGTIDKETVAFHIDMHDHKKDKKIVKLTQDQLLLPDSIKMVRCYPASIAINITEK